MKFIRPLCFLFCLALTACDSDRPVIIAVAANAKTSFQVLLDSFQVTHKHNIELVSGSSGMLTTQILQGAPYAAFISADTIYPYKIFQKDLSSERPKVYGIGSLVAYSKNINGWDCEDLNESFRRAERIGIPNPDIAPYGKLAKSWLEEQNISTDTYKFVFAQSVSQLNQYIKNGSVDIAITAKASSLEHDLRNKGHWVNCPSMIPFPIPQSYIILDRDQQLSPSIYKFFQFMLEEEGQSILCKFGYSSMPKVVDN